MKVLTYNRLPGQPIDDGLVTLLTDSSIVFPGRPLFLPPFSQEWEMRIVPVVEICRQGKYVSEKFARRYVGRVAIGARLLPAGVSPLASPMLTAFDGSLAIGPWTDIDLAGTDTLHIEMECCPLAQAKQPGRQATAAEAVSVSVDSLMLDREVAAISRRFTLRTGDTLIPAVTSLAPPVAIDTLVACRLNGQEALRLKIK